MALDTYAGLKASIAAWATMTDLTAVIPDFVTWAHEEICRRLRANVMLGPVYDLDVSGETVTQPTDFLAINRLYLDVTPRRRLQTVDAAGAMDLTANSGTGIYPEAVSVEGSLLRFAPLYSTATTGKLLYYARPMTLSADADTNVILAKYPYAYLYGALEALYLYKEDDNNADRFGARFGGLIESINASEAKDVMSGPVQVRPYAGGVV